LLSIEDLSKLALERAKTAREAITIMGELATEYGFHGVMPEVKEAGESLKVID